MATEKVQMPADKIYRELSEVVTRVQQEQRSRVVLTEAGSGHYTLKIGPLAAPTSGGASTAVPVEKGGPSK